MFTVEEKELVNNEKNYNDKRDDIIKRLNDLIDNCSVDTGMDLLIMASGIINKLENITDEEFSNIDFSTDIN